MIGLWTKLPSPDLEPFGVSGEERPSRRSLPLRIARSVLSTALAILAVLGAGFGLFAWHVGTLEAPAEPRAADAIIVVTGGQSRLDTAVGLLKSGKGQRLLISGVNPIAGRADIIKASGADESLFSCCVDLDRAALDTIGNAQESAKWMREHAYSSVILVTNNYHMPRTMLEMKRSMGVTDLQAYPVVNRSLDDGEWLVKPDALRVLVVEYAKFLGSVVRGIFDDPADAEADSHRAVAEYGF